MVTKLHRKDYKYPYLPFNQSLDYNYKTLQFPSKLSKNYKLLAYQFNGQSCYNFCAITNMGPDFLCGRCVIPNNKSKTCNCNHLPLLLTHYCTIQLYINSQYQKVKEIQSKNRKIIQYVHWNFLTQMNTETLKKAVLRKQEKFHLLHHLNGVLHIVDYHAIYLHLKEIFY